MNLRFFYSWVKFKSFSLDDKNGTASTEGEEIKVESNETKPEGETKEKAPKEEVPILELPGEASEEKASSDEVKSEETDKDKGQCCFFTFAITSQLINDILFFDT